MAPNPRFESAGYRGHVPGLAGFGRIFPGRPQGDGVDSVTLRSWLVGLGSAMQDDLDSATGKPFPGGDHPSLPAGYTYLGQFIDHDLTFEPTVLATDPIDIATLTNFRTPAFDLDSVLGSGPTASPWLYEGRTGRLAAPEGPGLVPHDLPRLPNGVPVIGDPRNDENLAVAQLHTAFITFYNTVFDKLAAGDPAVPDIGPTGGTLAEKAARIVRWHYQWMIFTDFLPAMVDSGTLGNVMNNGPRFYRPDPLTPFMPVEFAGAAYRFGHSMIRERYHVNGHFPDQPLDDLFSFTGGGRSGPPPLNWALNWNRFVDLDPATTPNMARRIDPYTAPQLHNLPTGAGAIDLASRNLLRGWTWQLPSGQQIATAMGVQGLTADEILTGPGGQFCKERAALEVGNFHHDTPLWYYILKEALVRHGGQRLGPVGGGIVAEVFVGILRGDSDSYLNVEPDWRPTLPAIEQNSFTLADLFRFLPVDAINPNGGDTGPAIRHSPTTKRPATSIVLDEPCFLRNESILRYVSVVNSTLACSKISPNANDRFEFRFLSSNGDQLLHHIYYQGSPIMASDHPDPLLRGMLIVGGTPTVFDVRTVGIGEDFPRVAIRATNLSVTGNWWWVPAPQEGLYGAVRAIAEQRSDPFTHFMME